MTATCLNRSFFVAAAVSLVLLAASGCDTGRDEYSFAPMIYDEQAFLSRIGAAGDLITLNQVRADYAVSLKRSGTVEDVLKEKWGLLAEKMLGEGAMIGRLSDELELWAFDFEKLGLEWHRVFEKTENGGEWYRVYFLFRVVGEFEKDYSFTIEGRLADGERLPEKDRERGYRWWHFKPLPPTTFWDEGEFVVVREDIETSGEPYELRICMDTPRGRHGDMIPLGVMRKIEEEPISEEEILAEDDPFRLQEWLSWTHARSGTKGEVVRVRHRKVFENLVPEAVSEDGVEFLGARPERVRPDAVRVRMLFRTGSPIDRDYWMTVYGAVAPEDIEHLSEERRREGRTSEMWHGPIFPPSSIWPPGVPVTVIRDLKVAPIAYAFSGYLYNREEKKPEVHFQAGELTAPSPGFE